MGYRLKSESLQDPMFFLIPRIPWRQDLALRKWRQNRGGVAILDVVLSNREKLIEKQNQSIIRLKATVTDLTAGRAVEQAEKQSQPSPHAIQ